MTTAPAHIGPYDAADGRAMPVVGCSCRACLDDYFKRGFVDRVFKRGFDRAGPTEAERNARE